MIYPNNSNHCGGERYKTSASLPPVCLGLLSSALLGRSMGRNEKTSNCSYVALLIPQLQFEQYFWAVIETSRAM